MCPLMEILKPNYRQVKDLLSSKDKSQFWILNFVHTELIHDLNNHTIEFIAIRL